MKKLSEQAPEDDNGVRWRRPPGEMKSPDRLTSQFVLVDDLAEGTRERMFALFRSNYDCVTSGQFDTDLADKDEAILLWDEAGWLRGFSTMKHWDETFESEPLRILFSGDTIIDSAFWGSQSLAFSWIRRAGRLKADAPERRLFWFLIVKGHRTYRYLPTFAVTFHPDWRTGEQPWLRRLADHLARRRFGEQYEAERGVVHFHRPMGQLVTRLAEPRPSEAKRPEVRYFLDRNQGYRQGDELVCVCELDDSNLRPIARRVFLGGEAC